MCKIYAEGYLTLLLADLLPSLPLQTRKSTDDLELEQRGCFSIWMPTIPKNCPWTVSRKNSVSTVLSCPGSSLRKFHTTFPDYVNSRRLDYARDLLLSTELSVTQIALDAGFGSSRTFFPCLSFPYHTTPGAYRRQKESS